MLQKFCLYIIIWKRIIMGLLNYLFGESVDKLTAIDDSLVTEKTIEISDFEKLSVEVSADTQFFYAESARLEVTAQEGVIRKLKINQKGQKTIIGSDSFMTDKEFSIKVYGPKLVEVSLKGSGNFTAHSLVEPHFSINLQGSGNIDISGTAPTLTISLSGSGDISTNFKSNSMSAEIAGSGNIDLQGSAHSVKASVKGSGNIYLSGLSHEVLEASVLGSGNIRAKKKTKKL